MEICKNCRQLFDPSISPRSGDKFVDDFLCSYHPGEAEQTGNTGPRGDYADVYRWTCCGKTHVGAVIGGRDFPPRRSPGCTKGFHVPDSTIALNPELAGELDALQKRLREIEAREVTSTAAAGVFVSYSHADTVFVDELTTRFASDHIDFWRDEKDLLVGEVIDAAISRGIQMNTLFLVVLSPSSIHSSWVQRELDEAAHEATDGHKILLPILACGLELSAVPARIRRFKCADFTSGFEKPYALLTKSIHAHLRHG